MSLFDDGYKSSYELYEIFHKSAFFITIVVYFVYGVKFFSDIINKKFSFRWFFFMLALLFMISCFAGSSGFDGMLTDLDKKLRNWIMLVLFCFVLSPFNWMIVKFIQIRLRQ